MKKVLLVSLALFALSTSAMLAQVGSGGSTGGAKGADGGAAGGTDGTSVTINLADLNPLNCPGKNDVDLQCVVERIVDVVSKLAIPIVAAMVLWGGMKIIMAGGNPKSAQEGRQIIYNAAIGFAIVLVANSVVLVIKSLLGAS